MTDQSVISDLQNDVKTLLQEITELKKMMAVKNEQDNAFRELIIEFLVNKKDIKIGDQTTQAPKSAKQKKNNETEIIDVFHKQLHQFLVQNNYTYFDYVELFNKSNIDVMGDKLKDNSANNVKNCFVWCYSHIDEIRIEVLDLPNIENYVSKLYNDKNEIGKHNKTLNDLLKYEGNELFKNFKDESYFKNYCATLKQKYKKLTDA